MLKSVRKSGGNADGVRLTLNSDLTEGVITGGAESGQARVTLTTRWQA